MASSVDAQGSAAVVHAAGESESQRPKKGPKLSRISAACVRCQRRKIRCDGVLPSCRPCQKAGAACISSNKHRDHDIPRAYVADLKSRVHWLESNLRSRCPEVDLEKGPPVRVEAFNSEASEQGTRASHPKFEYSTSTHARYGHGPTSPSVESTNRPGQPDGDHISISPETQSGDLDHEIGLVSTSAGTDPRYIGPSSGYFFAKLVLATANGRRASNASASNALKEHSLPLNLAPPTNLLEITPSPLPSSQDHAIQLSLAYFDTVHTQFPFLHQGTHMDNVRLLYGRGEVDPVIAFQVNMVLAIAATVVSRRIKVPLSAEGFCASAMKHLDQLVLANSLKGLQCLLLLLVYALNNPSTGLNMWYLNYQCIASLVDIGLQRDTQTGNGLSPLQQQLRRRAFWCIYILDKTLSTIMGRPVGLRDEDCDCQLPEDVDDTCLSETHISPRQPNEPPTNISNAIHLFKLAQLNSEIKYILNISSTPSSMSYILPRITSLADWQSNMHDRLRAWFTSIPDYKRDQFYITELSEIKYHGVVMLLFRPSPAIRNPSSAALRICYESAIQSIRLYNSLYKRDILAYSWVTVHTLFLSVITMLYCIWVVPEVAKNIRLDALVADLKAGSDVLSATGEHWPEAKRSRDALEDLSNATIRWLAEAKPRNINSSTTSTARNYDIGEQQPPEHWSNMHQPQGSSASALGAPTPLTGSLVDGELFVGENSMDLGDDTFSPAFGSMDYLNPDLFSSLLGQTGDLSGTGDVNAMIQGLFSDYQPMVDFG